MENTFGVLPYAVIMLWVDMSANDLPGTVLGLGAAQRLRQSVWALMELAVEWGKQSKRRTK